MMTPSVYRLTISAIGSLLLLILSSHVSASQTNFNMWLQDLRAEARKRGIRSQTIDAAFKEIKYLPRVIELDRKQPERRLTYAQYVTHVLNDQRIATGKRLLKKHRKLLTNIEAKYRVPSRFIVALWGLETAYGRVTGGFPILSALATLAHDGRRGAFFRREFFHALKIVDEGHITPKAMIGSWAGAMGQNQFMPSSFVSRAVDHNGDGRRDIWATLDDVFASTANYLKLAGWRKEEIWGRRVTLPKNLSSKLIGLKIKKPLAEWQLLGIRRANGRKLPRADLQASLVLPGGRGGPAYLVYHNFHVLMKWNRSTYFVMTVGKLADELQTP